MVAWLYALSVMTTTLTVITKEEVEYVTQCYDAFYALAASFHNYKPPHTWIQVSEPKIFSTAVFIIKSNN